MWGRGNYDSVLCIRKSCSLKLPCPLWAQLLRAFPWALNKWQGIVMLPQEQNGRQIGPPSHHLASCFPLNCRESTVSQVSPHSSGVPWFTCITVFAVVWQDRAKAPPTPHCVYKVGRHQHFGRCSLCTASCSVGSWHQGVRVWFVHLSSFAVPQDPRSQSGHSWRLLS